MSAGQQHKLRKLLQYHPSTAGGTMSPDYVWVERGSTVDMALEAVRTDDKAPHALLNTVFVTDHESKYVGSVSVADLLRTDHARKVEELLGPWERGLCRRCPAHGGLQPHGACCGGHSWKYGRCDLF
jgi:Mg/Co/Ni transporter MgtE